ncbi:hypothetical protein AAFF_G00099710 [Aldrovandia affinis]|uniref:Uncharacterized protein n=1 Tax=Aldrovandia affinis TaxID=143900 RepID=A0AAD7WCG7_9TELE|nr:hypothetical protein AAFF_G00099710 [Aldrovandia affinis]
MRARRTMLSSLVWYTGNVDSIFPLNDAGLPKPLSIQPGSPSRSVLTQHNEPIVRGPGVGTERQGRVTAVAGLEPMGWSGLARRPGVELQVQGRGCVVFGLGGECHVIQPLWRASRGGRGVSRRAQRHSCYCSSDLPASSPFRVRREINTGGKE